MIIGPDFVWLHLPKCGGSATEAALRRLLSDRESIAFDEIGNFPMVWHDSIHMRRQRNPSFDPEARIIISGIRRLPHWLLSLSHYEIARGERPSTREMLLRGEVYSAGGAKISADQVIGQFLNPRVDFWIRTENMAEDIATAFHIPRATVDEALRKENVAKIDYVRQLSFWFTNEELSRLYKANPIWASIEQGVYGEPAPEILSK